jgi:hypothetical protein
MNMVAKAPELPGWSIVALEDPHPIDFELEYYIKAAGIDPSELSFYFDIDDPDARYFEVYHPLCTAANCGIISRLADRAIYNLLGEYVYGMQNFDVEAFNSSTIGSQEVYPLESLPGIMSKRKFSSMKIDEKGNLTALD